VIRLSRKIFFSILPISFDTIAFARLSSNMQKNITKDGIVWKKMKEKLLL